MFQFVDRSGLFEIFDYLGIVGDVATVESKGVGGHLLHRGNPPLIGARRGSPGTRERFQAGRDHDFEVPFREYRVGILPIENFSLLRDANLTGKVADGLGENSGMSRTATASDCSAAAVEQAEFHIALAGHAVQVAM